MAGIKETTEAVEAVGKIGAVIAKHLKDGFETSDIVAVMGELASKQDVKDAIAKAQEGIEKVKDELADIDAIEGLDLGVAGIGVAKDILVALKSEPEAEAE